MSAAKSSALRCRGLERGDPARSYTYVFAFSNCGGVYLFKSAVDRAIADLDRTVRLDPERVPTFRNRGNAYRTKGDLDRAFADYDTAIRLDPKESRADLDRVVANLFAGSLATALSDLNQSAELDPKNAYIALSLDTAEKRIDLPSRRGQAAKQIDMTKWPAPIIRLYLGQMTREAALAAAEDPDALTKKATSAK